MISLKKNDKLIIIIAVVVVIIAGIGIAVYNPPEDNGMNTNGSYGAKSYDVMWETYTKSVTIDDELYAGRNSPFSIDVTVDHKNIVKVMVEIEWIDDSTYGLLTTKGADTLYAEVGFSSETWTSVYNGSMEWTKTMNSIPYDTTIKADDEQDALDKIEEQYETDDSLTFTIDVEIQPGERIFRPLKYLRDKGNYFDLTISYEYYDVSLSEGDMTSTGEDNTDPSIPPEDNVPAYLGMMIQSGLTRW